MRLLLLASLLLLPAFQPAGAQTLLPPGIFRDCPDCPEMVPVPSGKFSMGSPETERGRDRDEAPVHEVTIGRSFAVAKWEITFRQWDACVADGGCKHQPADEHWGRGDRPVIN